jgi:formylglycine-generating enzyme required for sulfatase activity
VVNEFYFFGPATVNTSAKSDAAAETWALIKDSQNPDDFEEFAKAYPNSDFAAGARIRAGQLRRVASPVARVESIPQPKADAAQASPVGTATDSTDPTGRHAGDSKLNPKDGLTYVWIPSGSFMMGCSPADNECDADEKPAHRVTITKGFWLGETPVTQAAYQRVTGRNPSNSKYKGDNLPVGLVTWDDGSQYCIAVGGRLPTEAEWEYAARAGTTRSRYASVDEIAWYLSNSGKQPHEVRMKKPNAWGLYDMLGNVSQYVDDSEGSYSSGDQVDPKGSPGTGATRGSIFTLTAADARVSRRSKVGVAGRGAGVGFRCITE